MRSSKPLMVLG